MRYSKASADRQSDTTPNHDKQPRTCDRRCSSLSRSAIWAESFEDLVEAGLEMSQLVLVEPCEWSGCEGLAFGVPFLRSIADQVTLLVWGQVTLLVPA